MKAILLKDFGGVDHLEIEQIREAHRAMAQSGHPGKIVVKVGSSRVKMN